jgi:hypothetical protein
VVLHHDCRYVGNATHARDWTGRMACPERYSWLYSTYENGALNQTHVPQVKLLEDVCRGIRMGRLR